MSALVYELGSWRNDDALRRGNDCLPRSIGGLKGSICRHHKPDDGYLERLAIEPRRRLKSISDAAQDAIGDVEISKPVSEKFLNGEWFDYAFFPHDARPKPQAASLDHFQNGTDSKENRFRAAPVAFDSKAVNGRGVPLTALGHRGEGHHRNLRISCAKKNSIIHTAVSPFRNSFGSALRAKCSSKSRLLTSAPTVVATNSVAHSKLAKASGRVGV